MTSLKPKKFSNKAEKKENNFLLNNIIKKWANENNKINNNIINHEVNTTYEQILDNTIIKNTNVNYYNLPNWPKRSPFEFYNKNVIIPYDYKIYQTNSNDNFNFNFEKLNKINDNLNPIISKNENDIIEDNNNNNTIKISILNSNLNENEDEDNNIIIIDENNVNNNETKNNLEKEANEDNEDNEAYDRNNNNNKDSFIEPDIIYDFGYKKEERLEPIQLSLIQDTIGEDEKKISNFQNQIKMEKYEQDIKENNIKNNYITSNDIIKNINNNRNKSDFKPKNVVSKTEKELEYIKEKDLFDEEINDENFNVTQKQMDILDGESNKYYNDFKQNSIKKNFKLNHPYLEYEKYIQKELYNQQNMDNHLTISQKNQLKEMRLKPIINKQKSIINNIIYRKYNKKNANSMINLNSNSIFIENNNNSASLFVNNSSDKNYNINTNKNNIFDYRPFSIKDYKNKYGNEKKSNFGGLGPNIGGVEWKKRQKIFERKKEYSNYVLFNEKKNIEEKKNNARKGKLIKKIKMNENFDNNFDNNKKIENDNNFKFPLINTKLNNENKNKYNSINGINSIKNENKIYLSPFFPMKKYKIKKETNEEKFNKILENNSNLGLLYHKHNIYNSNLEIIKSHIK